METAAAAAEAESSVTIAEWLVTWRRIVAVGTDTVAVDLAVRDATRVAMWGISLGIAGQTAVETSEVVVAVETLAIPVAELATWLEFAQAGDRPVLVLVGVVLATSVEALVTWHVTVIVEEAEEVVARVSHAGRKVTLQGTALRLLNKEKKKSNVDKLLLFSIQMVTMNVIARVVSVDVLEYVYWELVYHLYIAPI